MTEDFPCSLVAVHGLNENLEDAWTDPRTGTLWLRDLLPKNLDVARVLTFGYKANVSLFYGNGSADRIQQHAHTLVAELQAHRSLEECSKRPIVFICHDLGGILVKKALAYSSTRTSNNVDHLYSIFAATYAILFFGTPHQGTEKLVWKKVSHGDNVAEDSTRPADSQLVSAIEPDSETLQAITEQFSSLMKRFHIFFFWEEQLTGYGQRAAYVVDEASAAPIVDNTERAGIHATHAAMVQFSDQRSTSFRTVIEALCRYCRDAPPFISRRWEQAQESLARGRESEAFELAAEAFDIHNNSRPVQFAHNISERPKNKHFRIPQVVSSVFTGREDVSQTVEDCFWKLEGEASIRQQQRHIIHGVGGSGKTQFCCKFAQDHRERYCTFPVDAGSATAGNANQHLFLSSVPD
ncbi:MAG: hypothetical protein OHK93_006487 [Ramalina farinacea]|uniref:DUF676 domain-containing protein n=1 Tax=Ramalina farinacea TaxID=258253 RepID=A0AA43TT45_9LECA|nr:hypothetical protein [Ramalina farinacea]